MSGNKHKLFTYGTLRGGKEATHELFGFALFDYGKFPYITPSDSRMDVVYGNLVLVDDSQLKELDRYENIRSGLFRRVEVGVYPLSVDAEESIKAFVYVAGNIIPSRIESGDWFKR